MTNNSNIPTDTVIDDTHLATDPVEVAYCYRSGEIGFDSFNTKLPDGVIAIASGPSTRLREVVGVVARHAYDNVTLLVPGIPEAANEAEAAAALDRFIVQVKRRLDRPAD